MDKLVLLKYNFLFDPSTGWAHLSQFESDLSDFFSANGFETQVVKPIGGQMGDRIVFLKRLEIVSKPVAKEEGPAIKEQVKKVQQVAPTKEYKKYEESAMPKGLLTTKRPPQVTFKPGKPNTQKLRREF